MGACFKGARNSHGRVSDSAVIVPIARAVLYWKTLLRRFGSCHQKTVGRLWTLFERGLGRVRVRAA